MKNATMLLFAGADYECKLGVLGLLAVIAAKPESLQGVGFLTDEALKNVFAELPDAALRYNDEFQLVTQDERDRPVYVQTWRRKPFDENIDNPLRVVRMTVRGKEFALSCYGQGTAANYDRENFISVEV